ncbi:MAG TPA: hypothetical protein VN033_02720 [Vulgatibacter sp.]|nr:hypothetical protein [Vulgatibacter sp.]
MHSRRILALAFLPALLLAAGCASDDEEKRSDGGDTARIVEFEATPATVQAGEATTLSWITTDVSSVRVTDGDGEALDLEGASAAAGSVEVVPVEGPGASFTLVATSAITGAELRRTIDVEIIPPGAARIDEFKATPSKIAPGEKATISWSTTDAIRVVLEEAGEVILDTTELLDGEREVEPTETTRYVLTALGEVGDPRTAELWIEVEGAPEKPVIAEFTATPARFDAREEDPVQISLNWTVTGATSLRIEPTPGEAIDLDPEDDHVAVPVTESTSFRLIATNEAGSTEATTTVIRVEAPTVEFSASLAQVNAGDEITLTWTTSGAEEIELLREGVPLPGLPDPLDPSGEVDVVVDETSVFELRAFNEFGADTRVEILVEVGEVGIQEVIATPARVAVGAEAEIAWKTFGGSRILVRDSDGAVVEGCDFTDRADVADGSCTIQAEEEGILEYSVELSLGAVVLDTKEVEVKVGDGARILEFRAGPVVTAGAISTVSWRTEGDLDGNPPTLALEIDGTNVDLTSEDPLEGSVGVVFPAVGTYTLTLTATAPNGPPVDESVTVEAVEAATVTLTATPSAWDPLSGDPILVEWTSTNAVSLELFAVDDNGTTSVFTTTDASGSWLLSPSSVPVTYRMVATNLAGDPAVAEATVTTAVPEIVSFEASATTVNGRQEITLDWETSAAETVTLEPTYGGTLAPFIDVSSGTNIATFGNDQCGGGDLSTFYGRGCYSHTFQNGFNFPFGGADQTEMWIYNSGVIGFGAKGSGSGINAHMSATPGANSWVSLAPFWNSMELNNEFDSRNPSGKIYVDYGNDPARGDYVVVQWKNFWFPTNNDNDNPTNLNFEVVLFEDGSFDYRYGTMSSVNRNSDAQGAQAVIGFQTGGDEHVEISYRQEIPGGLSNYGFTFRPAEVSGTGSWTVVPLGDTTFVLAVENDVGSADDSISVTVTP